MTQRTTPIPDAILLAILSILLTIVVYLGSMSTMDKAWQDSLDALQIAITAALYSKSRDLDISETVRAYTKGDATLLCLFLSHISDESISFSGVREVYYLLLEYGVVEAERFVTAERVAGYKNLWGKVLDLKRDNHKLDAGLALCFFVMVDEADCSLAEQIIRERWPGSMEQAQALLEQMKQSPLPLATGSL